MSRVLATKGVSLTHDASISSSPSVSNNITINNIDKNNYPGLNTATTEKILETSSPQPSVFTVPDYKSAETLAQEQNNEIEFLKRIIHIYMNQPMSYQGKQIVCTSEELISLVQDLTGGQCELETNTLDVDCGCFSGKDIPILSVEKIWVVKDDERTVFKYSYPQMLSLFDEYNISIKFIHA